MSAMIFSVVLLKSIRQAQSSWQHEHQAEFETTTFLHIDSGPACLGVCGFSAPNCATTPDKSRARAVRSRRQDYKE
jgi:hypothetical protein